MKTKSYIFDIEDAIKYGDREAIMLQNLRFWIDYNKANNKNQHEIEIDGKKTLRTWTFNSVKAFTELFPFWTYKQIRRILESLENQNAIITGCFNKKDYDKTKWYALRYEDDLPSAQKGKGTAQKGKPIPDINSDSILKNTIRDSDESNKSSLNDKQLECEKFFDYWNDNTLLTVHKKGTKTHKECLDFFKRLKAGTITKHYSFIDTPYYTKKSLKGKKWTDEEIFKALKDTLKYQIIGYEPANKKKIHKSLLSMLFNYKSGYSYFFSAFFNPPKSLKKNITTSNEKLYNIVREIFDDLSETEEQKLIYETEALWKKFDDLYDKVHPYGTYLNSSHAGSKENPERLVRNFAEFHKEHNFDKQVGKVGPDTQSFRNFLKWMKNEHDCNLNPTERELKIMKIDYENYQMRKRNRG